MYAARSIGGRRGFYGLGDLAGTATYRQLVPGTYVSELRPFGISSANAPRVPQLLINALSRRFGSMDRPKFQAGWGSGAQRGKIWVLFTTGPLVTDEGRAREFAAAVAEAAGAVGGMLVLPGQVYQGGIPAALALPADLATVPARDLQTELLRAGFSLGPAGVDGDFGTASRAALTAAGERLSIRDGVREITRRSVTLTLLFWEAIQAMPDADAPEEPRRTPRPAPVPTRPETGVGLSTEKSEDMTTWWLVGAAALGLGALWYFNRKKKRAAA
jgi:hypothetical protein